MREIKFRGKTLEDRGMLPAGSWIKGGYYVDYCYGGCPQGKHYIVTWNSTGLGFADLIQVDPETVGQYTGLKDKQWAKEIYEGDIIQFAIFDYNGVDTQYTGVVVFSDGQWQIWRTKDDPCFGSEGPFNLYMVWYNDDGLEVIGNIYEHPHLLKGDEIE